ncbi:hypothetical protein SAMN04487820_110151 [Actinopolyspora mzabensis]|uniref:RelA/SpoT domain-containing protein n=1 Tax=Actinopolyspora mzabensis TaxID=995066 RepID=A0A1G9DKH3_ACTMZ|nr:hypothetical protein SAMN04487820_110151 [Actinopolyspora mzabensis]
MVTQRLKRIESIVGKLVRDKPRLGEIEDIAGCRAVLPDLNKVRDASEQLANARSLTISKLRDYNSLPTLVVTVRYTTGVAGTGSKLKFSFVRRTNRSGLS